MRPAPCTAVVALVISALSSSSAARRAWAVDTVETWDVGATDVDFYLGFEGLGLPRDERRISSELMVGYGIVERFSAYLGATLSGADDLSSGSGDVRLGVFGTPLDGVHVDLDLFLGFDLGGDGFREYRIVPALELNVDGDPEMESWGAYLFLAFPLFRRTFAALVSVGEDAVSMTAERTVVELEATLGAYVTIGSRHQLLVDFELLVHPVTWEGERVVEVGSVGIGYNVTVHDAVELINEVRLDVPQGDERAAVSFVSGLIATLPAGGSRRDDPREGVVVSDARLSEAGSSAARRRRATDARRSSSLSSSSRH